MTCWVLKSRSREAIDEGRLIWWLESDRHRMEVGHLIVYLTGRKLLQIRSIGVIKEVSKTGARTDVWEFDAKEVKLNRRIPLRELLRYRALVNAPFLHRKAIRPAYRLHASHSAVLCNVIAAHNPAVKRLIGPAQEYSAVEGGAKLKLHQTIEEQQRSRGLAEKKRAEALTRNGALRCEVCGFDSQFFYKVPAPADCYEVHHRTKFSTMSVPKTITLKDLAIVCANCHRILHRTEPMMSVQALSKRIQFGSRTLFRKGSTTSRPRRINPKSRR